MPFESSQEIFNDYEKLLETVDEDYNVIIYVGENENVKEIHAHSNILRIRSQYFCTAFSKEWSEKRDGKFIFRKPNISPQLFEMILRFIYCGKIVLEKLQASDVLKLLIAVDELKIHALILHIQEYLTEHQNEFLQQNPIEILEIAYRHETFTDLLNFSFKKICKEPEILFNSDKFINLKGNLLESLLQRDDLLLYEIDIWNSLIKWCLTQHSNISQNPTQWNNEEITVMERTIHKFIPLVRFRYISSENFVTKVYPFKEIIPKDLINNMLLFHMAPNTNQSNEDKRPPRQSKCNVDSLIINPNLIKLFANWIYRKEKIFEYVPYEFRLLYRASRDGNTKVAFHEKCDNKGATIVIIEINSEQIVGGYNPLSWDSSNTYKSTYDSFIFSFQDRYNFQTAKVGLSYGDAYSIGCHSSHGPMFGNGNGLNFWEGTWYSGENNFYSKVDLPCNFIANNYEVFQVIEK
ncbi:hypothetical protein C1645_873866 [Glomus cerebriforme]|uniref:BTB/POZ domain-containing protein n=1 Tax=Glomus cerebriforme TaxID=658196 RepID=A0A397T670_9GLOM|nr:hypothetical protein C1645_873866 [Glomus cerebriforme]